MLKIYQATFIAHLALTGVWAHDNGLAITPPMGWSMFSFLNTAPQ
jgi:hypothetical protein